MKQLTHHEAYSRLLELGVQIMEPYKGRKGLVMMHHNLCGHEFLRRPEDVFHRNGCRKCSGREELTQKEVAKRFKDKQVKLLGEYQGVYKKVLSKCMKCGHEWSPIPGNVFRSNVCPKCSLHNRITHEEAARKFKERGVEILGEYKGVDKKVLSRCVRCCYEWSSLPNNVFKGTGCPRCSGNAKLTYEEAAIRFLARDLKLLGLYTSNKGKVISRCMACGYEWSVIPGNIFRGKGCPQCAEYGFQPGKPGILYYLRVFNPCGDPLYKIGISNRTVKERFGCEMDKIQVLSIKHFQIGADAYRDEQRIVKEFSAHRYVGTPILWTSGNDELFTIDILGLDGYHQPQWLELKAT